MNKKGIDIPMLEIFLKCNYLSKAEIARAIGIILQDLQVVFESRKVGRKLLIR